MTGRRALVLGGSGTVGREVVRALVAEGATVAFSWHRGEAVARALGDATGARAVQLDLEDAAAVRTVLGAVRAEMTPDLLVCAAGVAVAKRFGEVTDEEWERSYRVGARSVFLAVRELAPAMKDGGDVVVVGGLDRAQSLPVPVPFAATQGMLSALVMSLAKELGPAGVRINMVALGPLESGLSQTLDEKLRTDYLRFSALRRLGTPAEAARAVVFLALRNGYMSGKVLPVNGGI